MSPATQLTIQRSLAAIMFADMVGYSSLMQENERRAYAARKRFSRALETATHRFGGEVVQYYGDGALIIFKSAVNASRAAVHIQRALRAGEPVPARIGIHFADVVRNVEGVYGTGVNVSARIEALAVPGSVLVSGRVAAELSSHPGLGTSDLGSRSLKNIDRPVRIFALDDPGLVVPRPDDLHVPETPLAVPVVPSGCETPAVGSEGCPGEVFGAVLHGLVCELYHRRVFRVIAGYVLGVLGIVTVLEQLLPAAGWLALTVRGTLVAGLLGLPLIVALAWIYDVTPRGIHRTDPARGIVGRVAPAAAWLLVVASLLLALALSQVTPSPLAHAGPREGAEQVATPLGP